MKNEHRHQRREVAARKQKRSKIDDVPDRPSIKKDWKPEYRQDSYGLLVSDLHGQYDDRNTVQDPNYIPLTPEEREKYLQTLMAGRLPRNYWRHVLKAGGCRSKKQAIAVRLWACCDRNGTPEMNGKSVPKSRRTWETLAGMMNRLGFRTDEGETWKKTRMQQYVYEGLSWMIVMESLRGKRRPVRSLEDMQCDVNEVIWDVLRMKRKRRNGEKVIKPTQTFTRISPDGSRETVTIQRPPIDWNAKLKLRSA